MNILAVFAHPSPRCFNRDMLSVVRDVAVSKSHNFVLHDLYAEKFDPVLSETDFEAFNRSAIPPDIKAMQDDVSACDVLVVIHPIWWFGIPAVLKGWFDRVFSYGFAYGHDSRGVKPLLFGKKAVLINTAGAAEGPVYEATGFGDAMVKLTDQGIFRFVGMDILLRRTFYEVPAAPEARRREMLDLLRGDLQKVL
jgi:Putative NADPH-quinone reductase (modulator of drug activity B)